jgi:predicted PurR-regulated permease PerM
MKADASQAARSSEGAAANLVAAQPQTIRLAAPSLGGVVRILVIVVAWRIRGVVRLVGISLFLGLALLPVVDALDNEIRLPRAVLILGIYVLLIASVILIGYLVVPSLVKDVGQLSHNAPRYAAELRHNGTFRHYDNRYHITPTLVRDARRLPHLLGHLVGPLKDVTVQAFTFIGQLLTVLAITFPPRSPWTAVRQSRAVAHRGPQRALPAADHRYQSGVSQYVLGNVTISVLATIATWIVLSILGVPYALSLAFVVGFFDLIPLVGATLGAIVVAFATVTLDFPTATIVSIAFIIVWQRFEDYVVEPMVYGRSLRVNPIVTIVSVLAGAALLGILGALLAIPIAAAIQIVLKDWWANRGQESPAPLSESSGAS